MYVIILKLELRALKDRQTKCVLTTNFAIADFVCIGSVACLICRSFCIRHVIHT